MTSRVRILLKPTDFSVKFVFEKNENKQKRLGLAHLKNLSKIVHFYLITNAYFRSIHSSGQYDWSDSRLAWTFNQYCPTKSCTLLVQISKVFLKKDWENPGGLFFIYFRPFHLTQVWIDKSVDGMLGTRIRGGKWKAQTNPLSYGGTTPNFKAIPGLFFFIFVFLK